RCAGIDGDLHGFAVDRQARHVFPSRVRALGMLVGPHPRRTARAPQQSRTGRSCVKARWVTRRVIDSHIDEAPTMRATSSPLQLTTGPRQECPAAPPITNLELFYCFAAQ